MKKEIRRYFLNFKRRLDKNIKEEYDKKIYENIINSDLYKNASSIFVYLSMDNEIDTRALIKKSFKDGKKVYVPKIRKKMIMDAVQIENMDKIVKGTYNIDTASGNKVNESPDLTLVPGLCFDDNKHRVGFGGAYYDNYIANHDSVYMGLFYSQLKMDKIPIEDHDQALDYIVTENGII